MKSEINLRRPADAEPAAPHFAGWFCSTRRGARLARLAAAQQLTAWGLAPDSEAFQNAALIVTELAASAITHGHVRGRDFELCLTLEPGAGSPTVLRIELSDARGERRPSLAAVLAPSGESGAESGRGLILVDALADRWGLVPRPPSAKTVWCELDLPAAASVPLAASRAG